jgi:hypothetical protein
MRLSVAKRRDVAAHELGLQDDAAVETASRDGEQFRSDALATR